MPQTGCMQHGPVDVERLGSVCAGLCPRQFPFAFYQQAVICIEPGRKLGRLDFTELDFDWNSEGLPRSE